MQAKPKKTIEKKTIEMVKLSRDLEGYVHAPSGFMPQAAYEQVRLAHPESKLPAHADLPPLNA